MTDNSAPLRQWFTLDELLDAVLGDIISVDARFQSRQAEAWRNFAASLSHIEGLAHLSSAEFTVGFGRLENLGLGEFDLSMQLDIKKAAWWRRMWWGVVAIFGVKPEPAPAHYRLADAKRRRAGRIELRISVTRDEQGRWKAQHQSQPVLGGA